MADELSCVIVSCNEGPLLRRCLERLSFCSEILLCDLDSEDETQQVAGEFDNVTIVTHAKVPSVEQVWPTLFPRVSGMWILRMDPDEEFPVEVADNLLAFLNDHPGLGEVRLYYQYYFRGRPLRGTRWGGRRAINKIYNHHAIVLTGNIHKGISLKPGFNSAVYEGDGSYVIKHFWCGSYAELLDKHRRYLTQEGKSRYNSGTRFSWATFVIDQLINIRQNLLRSNFFADGFDGVFLRFFYLWYDAMAALEHRRFQRRQER